MAKQIDYFDVVREEYENIEWVRRGIEDELKNYRILNVETLKNTIRFWYNKEE